MACVLAPRVQDYCLHVWLPWSFDSLFFNAVDATIVSALRTLANNALVPLALPTLFLLLFVLLYWAQRLILIAGSKVRMTRVLLASHSNVGTTSPKPACYCRTQHLTALYLSSEAVFYWISPLVSWIFTQVGTWKAVLLIKRGISQVFSWNFTWTFRKFSFYPCSFSKQLLL